MLQHIRRLYRYRDTLYRYKQLDCKKIFSDNLALAVGASPSQVRKDFSLFGITGNKRGGYVVDELLNQLNDILGKNHAQDVVIVGIGNIGRALMNYDGFAKEGIRILAGFDIDPMKHTKEGNGVVIYPLDALPHFVQTNKIKMGIIAVPYFAAQKVLDLMAGAGISGVLNFAPVGLKAPDGVFVNNINVRHELEIVNYFVNQIYKSG